MIFQKNRNITIFLTIAALMLWANIGMTQTEWVKHPGNPVLDPGPNGTWDDDGVSQPTVLFNGTEYQMWYDAGDGSHSRIGYATSADGIVWQKHPNNPVLDIGASGTWEDNHVAGPTVLFDGTEYHMWYYAKWRILAVQNRREKKRNSICVCEILSDRIIQRCRFGYARI